MHFSYYGSLIVSRQRLPGADTGSKIPYLHNHPGHCSLMGLLLVEQESDPIQIKLLQPEHKCSNVGKTNIGTYEGVSHPEMMISDYRQKGHKFSSLILQ